MDILDRVTTNNATSPSRAREVCLLDTRVNGLECLEERNELRRETLQRRDLACEERIATCLRLREQEECCQAWRLKLVRHVGVPDSCRNRLVDLEVECRMRVPEEVA